MFISSDTMEYLMGLGLSGEQLVGLVRRLDDDALSVQTVTTIDETAQRKRTADRERIREKRLVARQSRDVACDTPPSSSETKVSPTPPSKTQPSPTPTPPIAPPAPCSASLLADELWDLAGKVSRGRSGRPATLKAVSAALAKGATADALRANVRDHARTAGEHAKGLHRLIEGEHWREHRATPRQAQGPPDPDVLARRLQHYRDTREWKPHWGEKPRDAA